MERRRRKAASKAASSVVETKTEPGEKPAKLVLKTPAALSPPAEKKPRVSSLLDDCLSSETPEQVLEQLLSVSSSDVRHLRLVAERGLGVLRELWRKWRGRGDVCTVIVRVFVELVTGGGGDREPGEEERDFALQLAEHELDSVKVLGLAAVRKLSQIDPSLVPFALKLAHKEVYSVHHAVRVECLNLIGQLSHMTSDSEISLVTLEEYCMDPDPRVRAVSLQGLLEKQRSGAALAKTVYQKACDSLLDDDEAVRTVAAQLISVMVHKTPETTVSVPQKPPIPAREVRMCDDAFARVCDLLNDLSMPVRTLAASLLGDFHSVNPHLLEQTLDKKLMSHLKGVKSDHERQREQHAAGGGASGFDSGRTWGSSIPKLDVDVEERSLMSAGACGAFVHGLEDEYLEVRSAAVTSMCQLGTRSLSFAAQCVDFLVDMFNDEIQTVRLSAINSLRQVSATVQLREDQMETVLGVLEESSVEIREAVHSLLSTCQITTVPALRTTVHSLLDNLKKYSCDRESIWRCLQKLGGHHSHLVSCLVPELLNSHPFLMGKEPDVDDPAYVCILITVYNAAALCPTIPPLLPSHVFRHYTYLRDALPHLIPLISVGVPSNSGCKLGLPEKQTDHIVADGFLQQVFCRAQATRPPSSPSLPSPCSLTHRHQVLTTCVSDLVRVGNLDDQLSDCANTAATFLQCQLLSEEISQALSQDLLLLPSDGRLGPAHTGKSIRELILLSYRLETLCQGLGAELVGGVRLTRLAAHAMQLLLAVQLDMDTEQSKEFMDVKLKFQQRLNSLTRCFVDASLALPGAVKPLEDIDYITIATDSLMECLQPLIVAPLCPSLSPSDLVAVRVARATIHEPENFSQDDHTRFVYTLALSVPVQATLYNVSRSTDVAVQLKFPDGRRLLFTPKPSDIRSVGLHEARLDTAVVTSHGLWTDPCQVELCVGMRVHTDVPETTHPLHTSSHTHPSTSVPRSNSNGVGSHSEDSMDPGHCFLAISDVVKINIFPQETASRSFNVFGGL